MGPRATRFSIKRTFSGIISVAISQLRIAQGKRNVVHLHPSNFYLPADSVPIQPRVFSHYAYTPIRLFGKSAGAAADVLATPRTRRT